MKGDRGAAPGGAGAAPGPARAARDLIARARSEHAQSALFAFYPGLLPGARLPAINAFGATVGRAEALKASCR